MRITTKEHLIGVRNWLTKGNSNASVGVRHILEDAIAELIRARELCDRPIICHGDAGESERLYGLGEGHVLSADDVRDIQNLIADNNDELESSTELFHRARIDVLRELGGEELVRVAEARDAAITKQAVDRAMAKFYDANPLPPPTPASGE
jgi:hypothetical protein